MLNACIGKMFFHYGFYFCLIKILDYVFIILPQFLQGGPAVLWCKSLIVRTRLNSGIFLLTYLLITFIFVVEVRMYGKLRHEIYAIFIVNIVYSETSWEPFWDISENQTDWCLQNTRFWENLSSFAYFRHKSRQCCAKYVQVY